MPAAASVRLTYTMRDGSTVPVSWPANSFPIHYVIDRRVADAIPASTEVITRAFNEWAIDSDSNVSFQSNGVVDGARPGKDGQNSVSFADDLFKDQNFLALTTNWYDDSGHTVESDIQIDPSVPAGGYNLELLVEHEVGHLLGLDHSPVLSSVMYPYVGRGGMAALDSEDKVAITTVYPKPNPGAAGATLTGRVNGDSGGIFAAQVVALNDHGEPVATALTDQAGQFVIEGVPPGSYRLYAEPLDGPVDVRNLSGAWRSAKVSSFPTAFAEGGTLRVDAGKMYGNLLVNSPGSVKLNPKWVGIGAPGSSDITLNATTAVVNAGQTVTIAVGGDGFISGMTTFEIPNSGLHRLSNFTYSGNYVSATFGIAPDIAPTSAVVLVQSGNESAALTGALRITGPKRIHVARR